MHISLNLVCQMRNKNIRLLRDARSNKLIYAYDAIHFRDELNLETGNLPQLQVQ